MYTGPHLIKDNLVFGYDTGYGVADNNTSTRFYPGENTINLVPSGPATGTGDFYRQSAHNESFTYSKVINFRGRADVHKLYINPSGNTADPYADYGGQYYKSGGSVVGDVYAVSLDFYVEKGTNKPGLSSVYANGYKLPTSSGAASLSANSDVDLGNGWTRRTRIATITTAGNTYFRFGCNTSGNETEVYIDNVQVELKSHATPFADGTRSSTASLIDLTKTTDIDVSNVSFDSTGQPTFDGTDDILNTGLFSGRNPATDPFTIEAIVKSDITSGTRMWLDATSNGTDQRLYCAHASTGTGTPLGIQNSGWSHNIPQDTDFHHYVIVMDGSVARLYNNGEAHSTKNYTSYQIQALNVGGRSGYRWIGTIPVFKIHNQVLTADQVKQNYNGYKNRFDI